MKNMQKGVVGAAVVGVGAIMVLNSPIIAQPYARNERDTRADRNDRDQRDRHDNREERGSREGRPHHPPGPSVEQLDDVADLTPDQEKKVAAVLDAMHAEMQRLHEETKKKIDGILTAEQRAKLEQARENGPHPGPPPGDFDGPPPGERGPRGSRGNRDDHRPGPPPEEDD